MSFRTFFLSNNKNTLKKMSKIKEYVFLGNKILEYPDGTFLSTKIVHGEVESKQCSTLKQAQSFIQKHPQENGL